MINSILKLTVLASSLTALVACGPNQGDSLLTDKVEESSLFSIDKTPKSEELWLKIVNPSINATGLSSIMVTGECYVSTYPQHSIVATVNNVAKSIIDINPSNSIANTSSCKNGRFTFSIAASGLAAGSNTVRVSIKAYETYGGKLVTNSVQGAANMTITK